MYRQCKLNKNGMIRVAWVPEKFAKRGRYVCIKTDGEWSDGWHVEEVYSMRMSHNDLIERSQDYKHQRKASDI